MILLADELFNCILSLPLERCEGLWNEASNADGDLRGALGAIRRMIEFIYNALGKLGDAAEILLGFGGKSLHKIELDRRFAALKGGADSSHQLVLCDVFVYNVAQSLRSGLGGKG